MQRELRPVAQLRRLIGQQPLQAEQQREVLAPLDRWLLRPGVDLGQRAVQSPPPRRPGGERFRSFSLEQEGLTGELRRPLDLCA